MIPSAPKQPAMNPVRRRYRILYAEDVRELREVARMSLMRDGHTMECAEDGQLALTRVKADPGAFDLVITDHHMPNMNGLQFVAALRELKFPGKIIVFSSELKQKVHDEYVALQVDKILPKPIFPSELRQVLDEL